MLSKKHLVIGILVLILTIPLTVIILQKRTNIAPKASTGDTVEVKRAILQLSSEKSDLKIDEENTIKIALNSAEELMSEIKISGTITFPQPGEQNLKVLDADSIQTNGITLNTLVTQGLDVIKKDAVLDESKNRINFLVHFKSSVATGYSTKNQLIDLVNFKVVGLAAGNAKIELDKTASEIKGVDSKSFIVETGEAVSLALSGESTKDTAIISSIFPLKGAIGTDVKIEGQHFGNTPARISLGNTQLAAEDITSWTATQIIIKVPKGASSGKFLITTPSGTVQYGTDFLIDDGKSSTSANDQNTSNKPEITSFAPKSASSGSLVSITGSNFGATKSNSKLFIGSTEVITVANWSVSNIQLSLAEDVLGGKLKIITSNGEYETSDCLIVTGKQVPGGCSTENPFTQSVPKVDITRDDTATISWTTQVKANAKIDYGITTNYSASTQTVNAVNLSTTHSIPLTPLVGCTQYNYRLINEGEEEKVATSGNYVFVTSGCASNSKVLEVESGSLDTAVGGVVSLDIGSTVSKVTAPPEFSTSDTTFQLKQLEKAKAAEVIKLSNDKKIVSEFIQIDAFNESGLKVSSLDKKIEVTLPYDPALLGTQDPNQLTIVKWDGQNFKTLSDCIINQTNKQITCKTDSFSVFMVSSNVGSIASTTGNENSPVTPPTVDNSSPNSPAADDVVEESDEVDLPVDNIPSDDTELDMPVNYTGGSGTSIQPATNSGVGGALTQSTYQNSSTYTPRATDIDTSGEFFGYSVFYIGLVLVLLGLIFPLWIHFKQLKSNNEL